MTKSGSSNESSEDAKTGLRRKSGLQGTASTGVHARGEAADVDEADDEPPASSPVPDLDIDWDDDEEPQLAPPTPAADATPSPRKGSAAVGKSSSPSAPKSSRPATPSPKGAAKPTATDEGPPSSSRTPTPSPKGAAKPTGTGKGPPSSSRQPKPDRKPLPPRPKGGLPPRPGGAKSPLAAPRVKPGGLPKRPATPPLPAVEPAESLDADDLESLSVDAETAASEPETHGPAPGTPPMPQDHGLRMPDKPDRTGRTIGCCELFSEIATGGMATIHLGRWLGAGGFSKPVAVKALHPQYAKDPDFVAMFLDEARVVARIRHPNVTPTIDLVHEKGELFIVMEYIQGVTLAYLLAKAKDRAREVPTGVVLRIIAGVLHGLHAAHEATDEEGRPLCVIHRDVSPENIMVGVDGYARLIDFGIASALGRYAKTRDGELKGKLSYLSPEQVMGKKLTRRADVFSASIVLWQALTGHKLFKAENLVEIAHKVMLMPLERPSTFAPEVPKALDEIVMRGLDRNVDARWETAEAMAEALEATGLLALGREVGEWVMKIAGERIERNAEVIKAMEAAPISAQSDALERPMSIHPAPKEAIDEGLEAGLQRMRKPSINLLYSDVLEAQQLTAEAAAGGSKERVKTDEVGLVPSADHAEELEWTGDVEPAEPIDDEEQWEGIRDSSLPPSQPSPAAPPAAEESLSIAETPGLATDRPPRPSSALEHLAALPTSTKAIAGAAALVSVILVVWVIAALGGDENDETAPATATTETALRTAEPEVTSTAPPAPSTADTVTASEPDAVEPDAGAEPDGGAAEADAGADDAGTNGAGGPTIGPGKVPVQPWKPPTPRYVPPDL